MSRRTHCKNGHEFTPENTAQKSGYRSCKACRKAFNDKHNALHRGDGRSHKRKGLTKSPPRSHPWRHLNDLAFVRRAS